MIPSFKTVWVLILVKTIKATWSSSPSSSLSYVTGQRSTSTDQYWRKRCYHFMNGTVIIIIIIITTTTTVATITTIILLVLPNTFPYPVINSKLTIRAWERGTHTNNGENLRGLLLVGSANRIFICLCLCLSLSLCLSFFLIAKNIFDIVISHTIVVAEIQEAENYCLLNSSFVPPVVLNGRFC